MPHQNAIKQLHTYGPLAARLDSLTDEVDKAGGERELWEAKLKNFIEFFDANKLAGLVEQLSRDPYAYNRELAAATILCLWTGWKIIPYNGDMDAHKSQAREHAAKLDWTFPVLARLFADKRLGPVEWAILVASEIEHASEQRIKEYRAHLLRASKSRFSDLRLEVVRRLYNLYPSNDDGRHTLDQPAMDFMISSTKDPDIRVRDWACFELWLCVENLDERAEQAFRRVIRKEHPDSDVYLEAVTGLARMTGGKDVEDIIRANLERDDFGKGWMDAAEQSHSTESLDALLQAHRRLTAEDPSDNRIGAIEDVLEAWNDDLGTWEFRL
ncbi:MAG TPA: hypothetical protein VMR98_04190 [Candidatus Polarisedimenticolaceae bacterium]|nr:hypothetical protein [Candidatus Polarisedimenticolaceae bacterium]